MVVLTTINTSFTIVVEGFSPAVSPACYPISFIVRTAILNCKYHGLLVSGVKKMNRLVSTSGQVKAVQGLEGALIHGLKECKSYTDIY
jgi:hypothetical protein